MYDGDFPVIFFGGQGVFPTLLAGESCRPFDWLLAVVRITRGKTRKGRGKERSQVVMCWTRYSSYSGLKNRVQNPRSCCRHLVSSLLRRRLAAMLCEEFVSTRVVYGSWGPGIGHLVPPVLPTFWGLFLHVVSLTCVAGVVRIEE